MRDGEICSRGSPSGRRRSIPGRVRYAAAGGLCAWILGRTGVVYQNLVNQADMQFLVMVTDEYMESRRLGEKFTAKTFDMGGFHFVDCGVLPGEKG